MLKLNVKEIVDQRLPQFKGKIAKKGDHILLLVLSRAIYILTKLVKHTNPLNKVGHSSPLK